MRDDEMRPHACSNNYKLGGWKEDGEAGLSPFVTSGDEVRSMVLAGMDYTSTEVSTESRLRSSPTWRIGEAESGICWGFRG
jgi:hypothetical protein